MLRALLLASAWIAMTGDLSIANGVAGLLLGIGLGLLLGPQSLSFGFLRRLPQAFVLALVFLRELALASVRVARLVLSRRPRLRPAVLAVPIDLEHDWQITLLASLVTLTPGTLTIDVSKNRKTLYVHFLDLTDPERERNAIRDVFETRIRELGS